MIDNNFGSRMTRMHNHSPCNLVAHTYIFLNYFKLLFSCLSSRKKDFIVCFDTVQVCSHVEQFSEAAEITVMETWRYAGNTMRKCFVYTLYTVSCVTQSKALIMPDSVCQYASCLGLNVSKTISHHYFYFIISNILGN